MRRKIRLYDMPYEIMLVVAHASGVSYYNQVGGVVCAQEEIEGVLAPVELPPDDVERVMNLPYPAGRRGISAEIADLIDAVLASRPGARYLKVDRARLDESWEAWVHVVIDSPDRAAREEDEGYFGAPLGFGAGRGVLTWPNSD